MVGERERGPAQAEQRDDLRRQHPAGKEQERPNGLLGRSGLSSGEGLLLRPAGSVHTAFMRFAIDVVFLDRDLRVVKVVPELVPWRTAACRGSRAVLELPAGEANRCGLREGVSLTQVWRSATSGARVKPAARPT